MSTTAFARELPTEEDTLALAELLAAHLRGGDLLVLTGPLGAGKTFLAGALCRACGLEQDEAVTSPTFTLVHEYPTAPPISHADLYRLRSTDEVYDLDLAGKRDEGHLLLVEWGAPHVDALGGDAIELALSVFPRRARIAPSSGRARELLAALQNAGELS